MDGCRFESCQGDTVESKLYYEAHITIEPVFGDRLLQLAEVAGQWKFKPAELLMKKRKEDTPERSQYDTFCTTRSKSYDDIRSRTFCCIADLQAAGFTVWRYKIEDTLLDVRLKNG